jgi:Zn-dependent protease
VHWSFILLLGWAMLSSPGDLVSALYTGGLITAVFGCVLLHELGHALTARYFGIATRSITLYIIGGVARLERMSEKAWEEFWVAVAGPAVNVLIAVVLLIVLQVWSLVSPLNLGLQQAFAATNVAGFLFTLMAMNCGLVLFNMIPAFPMDGGRVLRALLASRLGLVRATEIVVPLGAAVGLLAMIGLIWSSASPLPLLVFLVVIMAGQQELLAVRMRARQAQAPPPLEVLPVVKPVNPLGLAPAAVLDLRPTISVYTWDPRTSTWIRESTPRQAF